MDKLDILIFGAHADDAEIGMGGSIAKHVKAGLRVGVCDLTEAEMSSNGTVELRRQEAAAASAVLGLSARTNLGLPDRGLSGGPDQVEAVVREIRRWRPRLVFAPYWIDRHPDHVACSQLVQEAVFNAKLRNYLPDMEAVGIQQLIFYYINDMDSPTAVVDVSLEHAVKMKALEAYASQFNLKATEDSVETPLTNGYLKRVEARDYLLGQSKGWTYAEGFAFRSPLGVSLF